MRTARRGRRTIHVTGREVGTLMSKTRFAVSITAHERADILYGQCLNILKFCEAPIIVIHINQAFRAQIQNDLSSALILERISGLPGVLINPENLFTKWAHMFHAHVSNARYLERLEIQYSHFVLVSSADLFFRRGAEAHVAAFDAGFHHQEAILTRSNGGSDDWFHAVAADEIFWRMLATCGASQGVKSQHEGTFYRRALLLRSLDVIESFIKDWHYNDKYPKEEYFLPSISRALEPHAKIGVPLAKMLGMPENPASESRVDGRLLVHQALRELGADAANTGPMSHWIRDPELCQPQQGAGPGGHYILGRLVRSTIDPLRQLVSHLSDPLPPWERAAILERLDCFDVISLDLPGRRHLLHRVSMSKAASHLLSLQAADPLLGDLAVERSASERELDACPTSSLPYKKLWEGEGPSGSVRSIHSYASRIAEAGAKLSAEVAAGALKLSLKLPSEASGRKRLGTNGRAVLAWACRGLTPEVHRALRFRIEGDPSLIAGLSLRLQYRGSATRRFLETGGIVTSGLAEEREKFFLIMRGEDMRRAKAELGDGFFVIHLSLPLRDGTIMLSECEALRCSA